MRGGLRPYLPPSYPCCGWLVQALRQSPGPESWRGDEGLSGSWSPTRVEACWPVFCADLEGNRSTAPHSGLPWCPASCTCP